MTNVLDRLLATLDTRLHAFAVCEVQRGFRLVFDPMEAVVIHYVLAGTGLLEVGSGPPVPFTPHCILIVPPRQSQSLSASHGDLQDVEAAESCSPLADRLIKFDARVGPGDLLTICGTITATYGGTFGLFDTLSGAIVEDVAAVEQLRSAFQTMLAELTQPGIGTRALTEALMKQCLVLLLRQHFTRRATTSPLFAALQDQRLTRAVTSVIERPGARHSLQDLAAAAGMSRSSFAARFSQVFGQSPLEFVSKVRLRNAAHLLSRTDLPIKVIATSVGYGSRSHFSRAFSAAYGVDPTTYRSINALQDEPPLPPETAPPDVEE
jgi:AraC-like DNA-binding protein